MKLYKLFFISILFLVSVGGVCATDTDNISDFDNSCLSDVNCSNTLTYDLNNDVICNGSYIDCCGAIAFQSVLKENGINITLEEANKAIHSVNGTTSMQGLIDGAKAYNLTAIPIKINADGLILHMNINGTGHWATIEDFNNYAIIITKEPVLSVGHKHGWKTGLIYGHGRWHIGSYKVPVHIR